MKPWKRAKATKATGTRLERERLRKPVSTPEAEVKEKRRTEAFRRELRKELLS